MVLPPPQELTRKEWKVNLREEFKKNVLPFAIQLDAELAIRDRDWGELREVFQSLIDNLEYVYPYEQHETVKKQLSKIYRQHSGRIFVEDLDPGALYFRAAV